MIIEALIKGRAAPEVANERRPMPAASAAPATATVATPATEAPQTGPRVATVAGVAVATAQKAGDGTAPDLPDDRITCRQCACLVSGVCGAVSRREVVASPGYRPAPDIPRRCEGFIPQLGAVDDRTGRKRWPSLCRHGETIH